MTTDAMICMSIRRFSRHGAKRRPRVWRWWKSASTRLVNPIHFFALMSVEVTCQAAPRVQVWLGVPLLIRLQQIVTGGPYRRLAPSVHSIVHQAKWVILKQSRLRRWTLNLLWAIGTLTGRPLSYCDFRLRLGKFPSVDFSNLLCIYLNSFLP